MNLLLKGLRLAVRRTGLFLIVLLLTVGTWQALTHPDTPLPRGWNPTKPLSINDQVTPLTGWKLRQALSNPALCNAVLSTGTEVELMDDFIKNEDCHIKVRVRLSKVGASSLSPVETTCETALRLALWEKHGVQPAAERHLKEEISRIRHFSSYNCRPMRTGRGETGRMSTHATASSIDVSGFVTKSGKVINLKRDWSANNERAAFLRDVNKAACDWFGVTLGPRYNSLHADHFHLQNGGWGLCR